MVTYHSAIRVFQMRLFIVAAIRPHLVEDRPMMEVDLVNDSGKVVAVVAFPAEIPLRIGQEIGIPRWSKEFLN